MYWGFGGQFEFSMAMAPCGVWRTFFDDTIIFAQNGSGGFVDPSL
jgi:hypothetical protein